jgi:hypothetical protein
VLSDINGIANQIPELKVQRTLPEPKMLSDDLNTKFFITSITIMGITSSTNCRRSPISSSLKQLHRNQSAQNLRYYERHHVAHRNFIQRSHRDSDGGVGRSL